jgi:glyoxylase-like metal-dependent hydrolase (beta-lactamase superfamily II)
MLEDAVFAGDTLFMPDYGTARCDFPGGRAYAFETTVAKERAQNVHAHDGVTEDGFVALRTARDATLDTPRLFLPSLQVNMRAGELPPPESNGRRYFKIPIEASTL